MVALQAGVFQPKLVHVRAAADGRQQVAEMLGVLVAVGVLAGDGQAIALLLDLDHLGFEAHVQFVGHGAAGHVQHLRIAELRHAAATAEDGHAHAEAVQRLPQFQSDHAGAGHGHGFRQVIPVKHLVAADHARTGRAPFVRHDGRGAGGNHEALGLDQRVVVDLQLRGLRKRAWPWSLSSAG
jgi:hypothetical protein